jgi:hypothetical protein
VHGFVNALQDTADYSSTTMLETLAGVQPSLKASSNFHGSDCEAIHQTPPLPSGRIAQYCTPYSVTGRVRSSDRWPPVSSAALVLAPGNQGSGSGSHGSEQYATHQLPWLWLLQRAARPYAFSFQAGRPPRRGPVPAAAFFGAPLSAACVRVAAGEAFRLRTPR